MNHVGFVPGISGPAILMLARFGELFSDFGESIGSGSLSRRAPKLLCPPRLFGGRGVIYLWFLSFPLRILCIVTVL